MASGKILASVGTAGAANKPDDVAVVQTLLNQFRTAKLPVTKHCGPDTVQAIVEFQKRFNMPVSEGRVDPNGPTWRRLVVPPPMPGAIMGPFVLVKLQPIERVSVSQGGYRITFTGPVPQSASVRLLVKEDKYALPDFRIVAHDPYGRLDPTLQSKFLGWRRWQGEMSVACAGGGERGSGTNVRLPITAAGRQQLPDRVWERSIDRTLKAPGSPAAHWLEAEQAARAAEEQLGLYHLISGHR